MTVETNITFGLFRLEAGGHLEASNVIIEVPTLSVLSRICFALVSSPSQSCDGNFRLEASGHLEAIDMIVDHPIVYYQKYV